MNQEALLASLGAAIPPALAVESSNTPSNHYSTGVTSSIEERAVSLLGSGINAESVASALGVTPARISQLLAEKHIADRVSALRYTNLQAHNKRDGEYDNLEDLLLVKLKKSMPLMVRPDQILKAIQVVNGAKRRGQTAPDTSTTTNNVVNLMLPEVIAAKFITNMNNQVTKAGEQELLTMPSGNLLKQVEKAQETRGITHEQREDN